MALALVCGILSFFILYMRAVDEVEAANRDAETRSLSTTASSSPRCREGERGEWDGRSHSHEESWTGERNKCRRGARKEERRRGGEERDVHSAGDSGWRACGVPRNARADRHEGGEARRNAIGGRAPLMMCPHRHKKGGRGVYIA